MVSGSAARLNVVVLPASEQRSHRAEGTGAGGEGERLSEAATEGREMRWGKNERLVR